MLASSGFQGSMEAYGTEEVLGVDFIIKARLLASQALSQEEPELLFFSTF